MEESSVFFTITAEILARSLAIFIVNKRTDTSVYNLCDASTSESRQFDNFRVIVKKQIHVSF